MKTITIYLVDDELSGDAEAIAEIVADALHSAHGPLLDGMLKSVVAVGEIEEPENHKAFVRFVGQTSDMLLLVGAGEGEEQDHERLGQ